MDRVQLWSENKLSGITMKRIIFLITILAFGTLLFAQSDDFDFGAGTHEFSVGAGFGHASLREPNTPFAFNIGVGLNFGYAFNINENFAIVTGLDFNLYGSDLTLAEFFDTALIEKSFFQPPPLPGFDDSSFNFFVHAQGIHEKQRVVYLYLPIMARYKFPVGYNNALYVKGGAKIGIPIVRSYSGSVDSITTSGIGTIDQQPYDTLLLWGFGTFQPNRLDGKLDLKPSVVLSFELGYVHTLGNGKPLYIGAHINYGITNILGSPNTAPIVYAPENINPPRPAPPRLSSFTSRFDSMNTMSFGITVRLGL